MCLLLILYELAFSVGGAGDFVKPQGPCYFNGHVQDRELIQHGLLRRCRVCVRLLVSVRYLDAADDVRKFVGIVRSPLG